MYIFYKIQYYSLTSRRTFYKNSKHASCIVNTFLSWILFCFSIRNDLIILIRSIFEELQVQKKIKRRPIKYHYAPESVNYLHPIMEDQLKETYGVMVYQEDVIKYVFTSQVWMVQMQVFSDGERVENIVQKKSLTVCGNEYISCLSLSEYYEHWKNIDYDWVKPAAQEAWVFLNQKAIKNYLN